MKTSLVWKSGLTFEAKSRQHTYLLSSPEFGGADEGACPKEHLLAAISGCTGIDVLIALKKRSIDVKSFSLKSQAESGVVYPKTFQQIELIYEFEIEKGNLSNTEQPRVIETVVETVVDCVHQSMSKTCAVAAIVAPAVKIFYSVVINREIEFRDEAHFSQ
ncbi:MAG: OsmC family protein [Cryobacterium sp.]|nr:OsmC family protein [Oligoflexia bacterium]